MDRLTMNEIETLHPWLPIPHDECDLCLVATCNAQLLKDQEHEDTEINILKAKVQYWQAECAKHDADRDEAVASAVNKVIATIQEYQQVHRIKNDDCYSDGDYVIISVEQWQQLKQQYGGKS